ncbi:MAG: hypothetical protein KF788_11725 [Piscinibacter sp.]|nr:hypothetical protein [Piscinibacter sp.]
MSVDLVSLRMAAAAALAVFAVVSAGCATPSRPAHDSADYTPGAAPAADPWYTGGGIKPRRSSRDYDVPLFESGQ